MTAATETGAALAAITKVLRVRKSDMITEDEALGLISRIVAQNGLES